ncbi:MAG: hypothetical protein C5B57_12215 [Blastocatellia bacterium]|nr:MAG: hypothetical protein C5B57_12215 [Blastocatellia bacterium]
MWEIVEEQADIAAPLRDPGRFNRALGGEERRRPVTSSGELLHWHDGSRSATRRLPVKPVALRSVSQMRATSAGFESSSLVTPAGTF